MSGRHGSQRAQSRRRPAGAQGQKRKSALGFARTPATKHPFLPSKSTGRLFSWGFLKAVCFDLACTHLQAKRDQYFVLTLVDVLIGKHTHEFSVSIVRGQMLDIFANYAVPACLFVLMFLSGTEIAVSDFRGSSLSARAVFLGVAGPLVALPLIALLINVLVSPPLPVGTGLLLLSLCPNGGISNYYCYLARCNVLLSATITAIGTLLSLLTISLWLQLLQDLPVAATGIAAVPSATILGQLIFFVILPMTIGISIRHVCPKQIAEAERWLKTFSIAIVALVLTSTAATVSEELSSLMLDIIASATLFIAAAMTLE